LNILKHIVCLLWAFSATAFAQTPAPELPAAQWQRIELGAANARYPFAIYSNKSWSGDLRRVKQAVLVFHGQGRNGDEYYAAAEKLLVASGMNADEVLLIAPNYFAPQDAKTHKLDGMPLWNAAGGGSQPGWNGGWDAINWPWPLSSFQPLDDLLSAFLDRARFAQLERIVVAGHSGGGQIVHRYAVLNGIDEKVRAAGKRLSYVIANPSSYLYFTGERPSCSSGSEFSPYPLTACPDYNHYRYGVQNLVRYAGNLDGAALFQRYAARDVTYLLGTADNDPEHRSIDKLCGARAQGSFRLERGRNYIRYERHLAGAGVKLNRSVFEVIDVDHDQARMFGSKCGATLLFGLTAEKNAAGAACRAPQF
jgi:hypothetical protein